MAAPRVCVPGERLVSTADCESGRGTYVHHGYIYSCLAGYMHKRNLDGKELPIVEVIRQKEDAVPRIGSIVTGKVTSVSGRMCKCAITCVERTTLREPFRGLIRKEDVRATEKDRVEMYKCFRPGDIVLARVLSLGDANCYLLSTAENELGVVLALSEAGAQMVPVSWSDMQCPKTGSKEFRKVAKVQLQQE
ncbi:PREDICTED: exosome complex component CSL4-like [Branchiostoma belcheri]|uniref:Exosome complex component CSL4-like n=1 Tax=Branchiostoma belcheri TaxID=7741 RepID=A0A6P5AQJ8_BRABE|nr:PREDICTED: exosome complex component CSL4-like [Branchiostoma belcheri]KAI8490749.1 Exosome complex component CSL4 [Branchiostoma belcheri]